DVLAERHENDVPGFVRRKDDVTQEHVVERVHDRAADVPCGKERERDHPDALHARVRTVAADLRVVAWGHARKNSAAAPAVNPEAAAPASRWTLFRAGSDRPRNAHAPLPGRAAAPAPVSSRGRHSP